MIKYYSLAVASKSREARDAVRLGLAVPYELRDEFAFQAGQHLPVQIEQDGRKIRRTYSICSSPGVWPLEIGIRVQPGGRFSEFAANDLQVGDTLQVMRPNGQFHASPDAGSEKRYIGFAAGSGITPILSIMSTLLRDEAKSRFILFYGNRQQRTTMFIDDLFALKNQYPDRLQLQFVFSREEQECEIASGRLDSEKMAELQPAFIAGLEIDEAFVCGPDSMIETVTSYLIDSGMSAESIHAERFGAPRERTHAPAAPVGTDADKSTVTIIMDGHRKTFEMPRGGLNIVDAAAEQGIELPYSCKGGVCATCRTHVTKGEISMATNYGLEPWELAKGFVLACQSTPVSGEVELDYDQT